MVLTQKRRLHQWLDYANQLHHKAIDLGLSRLRPIVDRLGLLPVNYRAITVGGTNGKGSCVTLLESIYRAQGYRVCTITSPELLQFNERLRINGQPVSDDLFCAACECVEQARGTTTITFFEFTILASLLIIKQECPDLAILEIGLGGRHDAVNIIDSDLAIITSIDFDHMEFLGNTREAIGAEKAGILRAGKFFVCGDLHPPQTVLQEAATLSTLNFYRGKDFDFQQLPTCWAWWCHTRMLSDLPMPRVYVPNAATALMAVEALQSLLPVDECAIRQGLRHVFIPGRFQRVQSHCTYIFDVAHNPASAKLLADNLMAAYPSDKTSGKNFAIFSVLRDKDLLPMIAVMKDRIDEWHIGGMEHLNRGLSATELQSRLAAGDINRSYYYHDLSAAHRSVCERSTSEDRVVVFGSFHCVAAVMKQLGVSAYGNDPVNIKINRATGCF